MIEPEVMEVVTLNDIRLEKSSSVAVPRPFSGSFDGKHGFGIEIEIEDMIEISATDEIHTR
jgi:hypothetical protein